MSQVFGVNSLTHTRLFQQLKTKVDGDPTVAGLDGAVVAACNSASTRIKQHPQYHAQFTLHDEEHLLRVTEIMALLIPDSTLEHLNPIEIALLILSAYWHDQGMVPDAEEIASLEGNQDYHRFCASWKALHPNYGELEQELRRSESRIQERARHLLAELDVAILSEFLRRTHAERAKILVETYCKDNPGLKVAGHSIDTILGKLCHSHHMSPHDITPSNGFFHDQAVGRFTINLPYLAVILRLADILDFDGERTPDALFQSIHLTNPISIQEWTKHRSIKGWSIKKDLIRFTAECEHPVYQKTVLKFMDAIDTELTGAHEIISQMPGKYSSYQLFLPWRTDRSRITPLNRGYIYQDLEFSLNRDALVKLLMTHNLYHSSSLCVRELLQNSLDALRLMRARFKASGVEWNNGCIRFEHVVDPQKGIVLRCIDNGVGMRQHTVSGFLTRAGQSYYRSYEFEQERAGLRDKHADFNPCAQFGIGFLSCLMLGDRISVFTRYHAGPNKGLETPLKIEINGLNSLVVIRPGSDDQKQGTIVEIVLSNQDSPMDTLDDPVKLRDTLFSYAIGVDFRIEAKVAVGELSDEFVIEAEYPDRPTALQVAAADNESIETVRVDFTGQKDMLPLDLHGYAKISFLKDGEGRPTTQNETGRLAIKTIPEPERHIPVFISYLGKEFVIDTYDGRIPRKQLCVDGIRVAGPGGRKQSTYSGGATVPFSIHASDWIVDVRGESKPELTPARQVDRDEGPSWRRLAKLAGLAQGVLWERVLERYDGIADLSEYWSLADFYDASVMWLPADSIWRMLRFPFRNATDVDWRLLSSVAELQVTDGFEIVEIDFGRLKGQGKSALYTVVALSSVELDDYNKLRLRPSRPDRSFTAPAAYKIRFRGFAETRNRLFVHFAGDLEDCWSVQFGDFDLYSKSHPLSREFMARESDATDPLIQFASMLIEISLFEVVRQDEKLLRRGYFARFGRAYQRCKDRLTSGQQPPYVWWDAGVRWVLTADHFTSWAIGTFVAPTRVS
jgi:hypothetical protein